jgi:hypothetical protein
MTKGEKASLIMFLLMMSGFIMFTNIAAVNHEVLPKAIYWVILLGSGISGGIFVISGDKK